MQMKIRHRNNNKIPHEFSQLLFHSNGLTARVEITAILKILGMYFFIDALSLPYLFYRLNPHPAVPSSGFPDHQIYMEFQIILRDGKGFLP